MSQISVYLNKKELEILSELCLEAGIGKVAMAKAIIRKFLIENQFEDPKDVVDKLRNYLTVEARLRSNLS